MNVVDKTAREELEKVKDYVVYDDSDVYGVGADFVNATFKSLGGTKLLDPGKDFDNIGPWKRRRCNLTNDGVVLTYVDDAGFSEDGYTHQTIVKDGVTYPVNTEVQVMVEQPKFWYKVEILEEREITRHTIVQYDSNAKIPIGTEVLFGVSEDNDIEGGIIVYKQEASTTEQVMYTAFSKFQDFIEDNEKTSQVWELSAVEHGVFISKIPNDPNSSPYRGISIILISKTSYDQLNYSMIYPEVTNAGIKKANFYVSATKKMGYKVHPAFISNGKEFDNIYIGAYHSTLSTKGNPSSKINMPTLVTPTLVATELPNNITAFAKIKEGWSNQTISYLSALQLLFAIEYRTFNFHSVFQEEYPEKTTFHTFIGSTMSLKNNSGTVTVKTPYAESVVSYRGQEFVGTGDNEYIEGFNSYFLEDKMNMFISDNNFSYGEFGSPYEQVPNQEVALSNGYISKFGFSGNEKYDYLLIPIETVGDSAFPIGDKFVTNSASAIGEQKKIVFSPVLQTNGYSGLFSYSLMRGVEDKKVGMRLQYIDTKGFSTYKTMTVKVDLSNPNPETCISYADDAIGMTPKSAEWDKFFGHYPCLFKEGKEVGKLNPNDFTKFENGTAADITSGNAGDVMIAFPRLGLKIETVGNILTVSMTDNPNSVNFEYNAHTRGSTRKEKFYLGAYKGYTASSKLRSISGKAPTASQTIGTFRTQAQANGAGYENSGFYQLTFRQAMYLLKYRNLNSQTAVGRGYVDGNSAAVATGGTNTKGMDFGETTGKLQMKLFGLEDFYGNVWEWIDGVVTNSTRNILTATTGFNDAGTGYVDQGQGVPTNISGCLSKPQGTTKTGFLAKEVTGSITTYFCDYVSLNASCIAYFGGTWNNASDAGVFRLYMNYVASTSHAAIASRLMYL